MDEVLFFLKYNIGDVRDDVVRMVNGTSVMMHIEAEYYAGQESIRSRKEIYLFGSYARKEADESSDIDFLVFGGENFKLTLIFALAEELRKVLKKDVDVFEISEINTDSRFYKTIMQPCSGLLQRHYIISVSTFIICPMNIKNSMSGFSGR